MVSVWALAVAVGERSYIYGQEVVGGIVNICVSNIHMFNRPSVPCSDGEKEAKRGLLSGRSVDMVRVEVDLVFDHISA